MRSIALLLAGAAFFASNAADATVTVYTDLASFQAATTARGVDTYTGFNISGQTSSPIVRTAGAYTYTASAETDSFFGAGTTLNPWLSTNVATDSVLFSNFSSGVSAIGGNFFGSDINGLFKNGNITITALDALGATSIQTITNATTSSFLGFVSNGNMTSLTVDAVQPNGGSFLWPTIDNLTLGKAASVTAAVPEPATWAMMIMGFGMVGYAMRRRRVTKVSFAA